MDSRARITPSLSSRIKEYDTYNRDQATYRVSPVIATVEQTPKTVFKTVENTDLRIDQADSRQSVGNTKNIKPREADVLLRTVANSLDDAYHLHQPAFNPPKKSHSKIGIFFKSFYILGFSVFMFAGFISVQSYITNLELASQQNVASAQTIEADDQGVPQGTGSEPAEEIPTESAFFNYKVDSEKPRYLRIPKLSTYSRIKEADIVAGSTIDAPWNIHDANWYKDSVLPGSKQGVSLLVGHVSGNSLPGIFKNIASLVPGENIEIERGDGTVIKYRVEAVEEYPIESIDMTKILSEVPAEKHSLRLLTSSGDYNEQSESFATQTVVYASPIN